MDGMKTCCICHREFGGWGNNPEPFCDSSEGECCDECNADLVMPARLAELKHTKEKERICQTGSTTR